MSVGVSVLRVWPSKSSVTAAMVMPWPSAGLLACKCKSTVAAVPVGFTKSGTATALVPSCPFAACHAVRVVRSTLL